MSETAETIGEHGARLDQLEKDKTAIFDLHNEVVVPALADIKVISKNVKDTSEIIANMKKDFKGLSDTQIQCAASREAEARVRAEVSAKEDKQETKGMNLTTKVGVWVGICTGILTFLGGAAIGVYQLLKMLLETAKG